MMMMINGIWQLRDHQNQPGGFMAPTFDWVLALLELQVCSEVRSTYINVDFSTISVLEQHSWYL